MQLTVRDIAQMWKVHENVVYRWVADDKLPAETVNGQYRFNRTELLEWATLHKMVIPPELFRWGNGGTHPAVDEALRLGGMLYQVKGTDKESILQTVVDAMPLPSDLDRTILLQVFLSRESLGSTAVGDGIALPHPRYPMVLPVPQPFITLTFLEKPIPYGAADRQPVHTLFALVSPTMRVHLALLARLSCALRDEEFRAAVRRQAPRDEILSHARRVEASLEAQPAKA
jgi:PTS system nitrogen regulatory IIA component